MCSLTGSWFFIFIFTGDGKSHQNRWQCDWLSMFYLLELLVPLLLPDDLTVENHRGGAQAERSHLSQPVLHKWLQVRVQLYKGGTHKQSMMLLRNIQATNYTVTLEEKEKKKSGWSDIWLSYPGRGPANEQWGGQFGERQQSWWGQFFLLRAHFSAHHAVTPACCRGPADQQLQGASARNGKPLQHSA